MALKGNIEVKADGTSYSETVEVGAIYYHSTENKLKLCTNASGAGTWVDIKTFNVTIGAELTSLTSLLSGMSTPGKAALGIGALSALPLLGIGT